MALKVPLSFVRAVIVWRGRNALELPSFDENVIPFYDLLEKNQHLRMKKPSAILTINLAVKHRMAEKQLTGVKGKLR
jgi:hypothetical protein